MNNKKHLVKIGLVLGILTLSFSTLFILHTANAAICIDPYCVGGGGGGGGVTQTAAPHLNAPTTNGSYQINLSWTGTAQTFYIYRSIDGGGTYSLIGTSASNSYSDTGISCETNYYYEVKAFNTGETISNASNSQFGYTMCPPILKSATPISSSAVNLIWNGGRYRMMIYAPVSGNPPSTPVTEIPSASSTYTVSGLSCGTSYDFSLAIDSTFYLNGVYNLNYGTSSMSNVITAQTQACSLPAPTLNSVTPTSQTMMSVTFTNNDSSGTDGFYIYRNGVLSNITSVSAAYGTQTTFLDGAGGNNGTSLTCGTTYSYYVKAYNGSVYSANSNTLSGTTLPCTTALNSDPYFLKISDSILQPSYIDSSLASDTVYIYRVRAKYANGTFSNWAVAKAAKTLIGSASITSVSAPVCTRNSYCDFSLKSFVNTPGEVSEIQCANNNDCRKVGKLRSTYQEQ